MNREIRLPRGLVALTTLASVCGTVGLSPKAEADLALDIVSDGTELGSIAFPAATGSSSTGVTFELRASGSTFTQDDITAVSWELDPASLEVVSLSLTAFHGPLCTPAEAPCSHTTLNLSPQTLQVGGTFCPPPPGFCTGFQQVSPVEFIAAAPAYACVGFEPPLADGPVTVKGNRALPLKAELVDQDGLALTDADLSAAPVVQVDYHSGIAGTPEDVSDQALWVGQGSDGNAFVFSDDRWRFNLKVGNYTAPGTYVISMTSGDGAEYRVDPSCEAEFIVNP